MNPCIAAMHPYEREFQLEGGSLATLHVPGTAKKVLLLHGNSSCKEVFAAVIPELIAGGHEVLAIDLPGHGNSSDAQSPDVVYCFPGYAAVVRALLDRLEWNNFIVVGWSLGGHVALELAALRPDCSGIMLIGSPPGKPSPEALQEAFIASGATLLAGKLEFSEVDAFTYVSQMLGVDDVD
ncbi:MAG: alpha/beta fold hydrolase, partial [Hyphomicrobium sp.]